MREQNQSQKTLFLDTTARRLLALNHARPGYGLGLVVLGAESVKAAPKALTNYSSFALVVLTSCTPACGFQLPVDRPMAKYFHGKSLEEKKGQKILATTWLDRTL